MKVSFNIKKSYFIAIFALILVGIIYAANGTGTVGHSISEITADANLDMVGNKLTNLGTPTDAGDSATKAYVDSLNPMIQLNTISYSTCTYRDNFCNLPIYVGNENSPQIAKPAWAKNMHLRCSYGCTSADNTATWILILGDTQLYYKTGGCPKWDTPTVPFSGNILEKTFDISAIPEGSLLKAQAKSDYANQIGYCSITFT